MGDRNEQAVLSAIEAFNRGDYEGVLEFTHPEIDVERLGGLSTVSGREAAFGLMVPDAFDFQRMDVEQVRVEGDVVLVSAQFQARGAGSGIELNRQSHNIFWLEDGLIKRMATYLDRDEALAAAGLADRGG